MWKSYELEVGVEIQNIKGCEIVCNDRIKCWLRKISSIDGWIEQGLNCKNCKFWGKSAISKIEEHKLWSEIEMK